MSATTVTIDELDALRAPLTGYCYRLLGSAADTDDAVQETLIRACAKADRFDPGRAQLSTWVHRIATNVCLDMLRAAKRRALVIDVEASMDPGAGRGDSGGNLGAPLPSYRWVEPMPDPKLIIATDPADAVQQRESVRLAFIAALQHLPPRQRAVLVLRDVLAFSARECAEILEVTVPSVTSALQRARAALERVRPEPADLGEPADRSERELLQRYVSAFERHDVAELTAVLREDAVTSMPPFSWRLEGGPRIAEVMGASDSCAGARLVACGINGEAGFGQYRPDADGVLRPFALMWLSLRGGRIGRLITFLGTQDRFCEFGLPTTLDS